MTLIEFNDLGNYVMKKKSKLTIFRPIYKYDGNNKAFPITYKELKAINKQIEELGWEVVDENN